MSTAASDDNPVLWGITRCGKNRVQIFTSTNKTFCREMWGETDLRHGLVTIILAHRVLKMPVKLRALLIHEFTHIIEYTNDPKYLSTAVVDDCTLLAQTMEVGMTDLIVNLKVKKRKFVW